MFYLKDLICHMLNDHDVTSNTVMFPQRMKCFHNESLPKPQKYGDIFEKGISNKIFKWLQYNDIDHKPTRNRSISIHLFI